jgi:ATP-dependent RNA helicase DDX19/DBP5
MNTIIPSLNDRYRNFIGQSQSGTGKTGAFTLAALSRVDPALRQAQVIVLAPTRELAHQILGVVRAMAQFTGITATEALKDSVPRGQTLADQVVVGTPGTVQDLIRKRSIPADKVCMFIIDEADVMLDRQGMGDQTIRIKQ